MARRRIGRLVAAALLGAVCVAGTITFHTQVAQQPTPVQLARDPGSGGTTGG